MTGNSTNALSFSEGNMGIYIPGIEMPKDITLFSVSPDGTIDIVHGEGDLEWKTLKEKAVYVSLHGDLIDREHFVKRLKRQKENHEKQAKLAEYKGTCGYTNDMYIVDRNRDLISMLNALSAVIPAEEERA